MVLVDRGDLARNARGGAEWRGRVGVRLLHCDLGGGSLVSVLSVNETSQ